MYRPSGALVTPTVNAQGYLTVSANTDGVRHWYLVHRLVASAYCDGYAPDLQVNHKNGVKTANYASNLEWVKPQENMRHAVATGLHVALVGEQHPTAKLTASDVVAIRAASTCSTIELAKQYNVTSETIRNIRARKSWRSID